MDDVKNRFAAADASGVSGDGISDEPNQLQRGKLWHHVIDPLYGHVDDDDFKNLGITTASNMKSARGKIKRIRGVITHLNLNKEETLANKKRPDYFRHNPPLFLEVKSSINEVLSTTSYIASTELAGQLFAYFGDNRAMIGLLLKIAVNRGVMNYKFFSVTRL